MKEENKKRDPMPPPDATPEEIGEFWDTHSLADYWDETHEVEFQVNLKSDQNQTLSDEKKHDLSATTEDASNTALDVVTEDEGSTELDTIADLISSLNLPIWIARNASKAFRQLCSAAVKWPAAFFEGKASESHAVTEANTKITEAVTNQIIQQIQVPPEYAQIAVRKHLEKIIGEQLNLDKISAIAADELKSIESDNPTSQNTNEPNQEQSADSINQDANEGEKETISDVWLNIFETEARPQSTEEGQLLFGRILAGEIKNPGSYSTLALKTLGELDQSIAVLFKKLCSACAIMEFPLTKHIAGMKGLDPRHDPKKNVCDMRVPSLGGDPGQDDLSKYGLGFSELNILNEYRLIISSYNTSYEYNLFLNKENVLPILSFRHQRKDWILLPLPGWDKSQGFKWSGVALSRVGRELFHIVDQDPMPEYTEDLKKYFAEQNLTMAEA